ncbi:hypothetical protein G7054_g6817 [Neopestalotiopsis clavispora]|nr:hypothetical protein E8E14_005403 [Neopestalotiopsis sp. 37M]KAF7533747.1 hypothetical protein G7054_g6817 [Neopestalotiopsis clavispora]
MSTSASGKIGQRLLPVIIDEVAQNDPNRTWACLPVDDYDLSQGFEDVTYAAFANAINKLAYFIEKTFGRSDKFDTIIYLGIPDIRYYMLPYAACKTGHKIFFSSPHNTLETHLDLIERTQCKAIMLARGVYARDIINHHPMPKTEIPELDDLLDLSDVAPIYPYNKTYEEAKTEPLVLCHSSGSTSDPRPVTFTHASMACFDNQTELPDVDGRGHWTWQCGPGVRYFMIASPFHPIAIAIGMAVAVFGGGILVPGFRHRATTEIGDVCEIIKGSKATTGFIPYFLADVIARLPDAEEIIKQFDSMAYGNGTVTHYGGEVWSRHTKFQNIWGASDTLTPPVLKADPEDYEYNYFDMEAAGIRFQERDLEYYDEDGSRLPLYELVLTLTPQSQKYAGYWAGQGITEAPSAAPYPENPTAELWTPHPDPKKSGYAWRFVSRLYDLERGNEFCLAMEAAIDNLEKVQKSIVLSKYHEQPVALVELARGLDVEAAADIWQQTIEPQNEDVPEHSRIPQTHVIPVQFGSFIRGTEGHLNRKQTEKKYASDIDAVYGRGQKKMSIAERPRYESIIATTEIVQSVD